MAQKRWFNPYMQLDQELHQWIYDEAAREGQKVGTFVERLLKRAKARWEDDQSETENQVIILDNLRAKGNRIHTLHAEVRELRNLYFEHPTEAMAELLKDACDVIGTNYESYVEEGLTDPFSTFATSSTETTLINQCLEWMFSTFKKHEVVAKSDLAIMGQERGFNSKMLDRAKERLNNNLRRSYSPKIQIYSHRIGNKWYWYFDNGSVEILQRLISLGALIDSKEIEKRKKDTTPIPFMQLQHSKGGERNRYVNILSHMKTDLEEVDLLFSNTLGNDEDHENLEN